MNAPKYHSPYLRPRVAGDPPPRPLGPSLASLAAGMMLGAPVADLLGNPPRFYATPGALARGGRLRPVIDADAWRTWADWLAIDLALRLYALDSEKGPAR